MKKRIIHYEYMDNGTRQKPKIMIKRIFNWKTTLTAIVIAIVSGLQWEHGQALGDVIVNIIAFISLILAKD